MQLSATIRRSPFARLLFFYIAGILTSQLFHIADKFLIILFFLVSAVILTALLFFVANKPDYHTNWLSGLLSGLILFAAGIIVMSLHIRSGIFVKEKGIFNGTVMMEICEPPVATKKAIKTTAIIKYRQIGDSWNKHHQQILLFLEKDSSAMQLSPGDHILGNVKSDFIPSPVNPEEFDYNRYLAVRSIYHQAYLSTASWKNYELPATRSIRSIAMKCQLKLLQQYRKIGLNKTLYSILSALTLGYKSDLEIHTRQVFSKAGVMHVMALSGFNVAVIAIVLGYLLFFSDRYPGGKLLKTIVIILVIWAFAFITGLSASVTRAAVMITLVLTGSLIHRKINTGNILFVSAFIILTVAPLLIVDIGFQLSFAAVLGIIVFQPPLYGLMRCRNKITDKIWQLFTISCAAQLSTLPLTLYYFHQFPVYFWLTNLYVVPLVSIIICVAGFFLLVSFFEPLMILTGKILGFLLGILYKSVVFTEVLPYSVIENVRLCETQTIILSIILILMGFYFWHHRHRLLVTVLGLIITFQIIHVIRLSSWNRQEIILIGNCKGKSVINLIKGRECMVLAEPIVSQNELQYAFKSFWIKQGVADKIQLMTLNQPIGYRAPWMGENILIHFAGKQLMILKDNSTFQFLTAKPLSIDLLVVTGNVKPDINALMDLFQPGLILVDPTVKYYQAEKWMKLCREKGIDCWIISRQGAYLLASG